MLTAVKVVFTALFWGMVIASGSEFAFGAHAARTLNLPDAASGYAVDDEDAPDVTARVARISFLTGDSKIRRDGSKEWEKATLNLPLVEGDEIATDTGARVEIQLGKDQHVRLAEDSLLKIVTLRDEGVALSISLGTLTVRALSLDKDKTFFEIDAPKTTIALQRAGAYRIDAGKEGDSEIHAAAAEGGEARVYSDSVGFTLKNGRSARIFIDGPTAGEWESADAAKFTDDFDRWSGDRDLVIAQRLKDAFYDKYYDADIYGADDLNDYGQWVYTKQYGYVWRPSSSATASYANWSPYRYGHWRWMQPFGWIWVNDEPWGWATYHHGRWVYDNGYWAWSPYGFYRTSRSWWSAALVSITVINNNVYWYPLSYRGHRDNFNDRFHGRGDDRDHDRHGAGGGNGNGQGTPRGGAVGRETIGIVGRVKGENGVKTGGNVDRIPPRGVVTIPAADFGTRFRGVHEAPDDVAQAVLKKGDDNAPLLPRYTGEIGRRTGIVTEKPRVDPAVTQARVGAAPRKQNEALDNELRTTRVFGGRMPRETYNNPGSPRPAGEPAVTRTPRDTGVFDRPVLPRQPRGEPRTEPADSGKPAEPRRSPRSEPRDIVTTAEPKRSPKDSPRFEPPPEQPQPTRTPREMPRSEAPPEREKPHDQAPRVTPPAPKETPHSQPPAEKPKADPPKSHEETKDRGKADPAKDKDGM